MSVAKTSHKLCRKDFYCIFSILIIYFIWNICANLLYLHQNLVIFQRDGYENGCKIRIFSIYLQEFYGIILCFSIEFNNILPKMRIIDRFSIYMDAKGLNDNKVTKALGVAIGTIGKSRNPGRDLSKRSVRKILSYYTDLSETWLKTGEGEMLCVPDIVQEPDVIDEVIQNDSPVSESTFEKLIEQYAITASTINSLVKEISKVNELVAKSQEQLDKMIEMVQTDK